MSRFAFVYEDPDYEYENYEEQEESASVDIPELDEIYSPYNGA